MTIRKWIAATGFAVAALTAAGPASAQECFIGEVKMFAGNFAPRNYAFAHGQIMSINDNQALYSIVGTIYGGDGKNTFALPDLRGRVPIGAGQGPGLDNVNLGQKSGDAWTQPRQGAAASGDGAAVGTPAPITNMQPSTGINYVICLYGIYPSRS